MEERERNPWCVLKRKTWKRSKRTKNMKLYLNYTKSLQIAISGLPVKTRRQLLWTKSCGWKQPAKDSPSHIWFLSVEKCSSQKFSSASKLANGFVETMDGRASHIEIQMKQNESICKGEVLRGARKQNFRSLLSLSMWGSLIFSWGVVRV